MSWVRELAKTVATTVEIDYTILYEKPNFFATRCLRSPLYHVFLQPKRKQRCRDGVAPG